MKDILVTLHNPTIFNGLTILTSLALGIQVLRTDAWQVPKIVFSSVVFAMVAMATWWLNYFAWKNPRHLSYGPNEFLRESELEHERTMSGNSKHLVAGTHA